MGIVVATSASAQQVQPVPTAPPATQSLLEPLNQLSGSSIAKAIDTPDTRFDPAIPTTSLGRDGANGRVESTTPPT